MELTNRQRRMIKLIASAPNTLNEIDSLCMLSREEINDTIGELIAMGLVSCRTEEHFLGVFEVKHEQA